MTNGSYRYWMKRSFVKVTVVITSRVFVSFQRRLIWLLLLVFWWQVA